MSVLKTLSLNIVIFLVLFVFVDQLVGPFLPSLPVFLNSNDEYASNPRGYFQSHRYDQKGQKYYFIDRSLERDRVVHRDQLLLASWRVLAIGDSFVYGSGVYLKDSFIKQLERHPDVPARTLGVNLGRAGMDIAGIAKDYFDYGDRDLMDVVVYGYVLNDPIFQGLDLGYFDVATDPALEESPLLWDFINLRSPNLIQERSPLLKSITEFSPLIHSLVSFLELRALSQSTIDTYHRLHQPKFNQAGLAQTFALIEKIHAQAQLHQSRFIVAIIPLLNSLEDYPFKQIHSFMVEELSKRQIEVIDLLPVFEGKKTQDLWVHPSDQHPNELAHAMIANALAPMVTRNE